MNRDTQEITKESKPNLEKLIISKEILPSLIKEYYCVAESKGIKLNYYVHSEELVLADKLMVTQILFHLVDNAVNFTDQGEVSVNLFVNNSKQYLEVKDTGVGISEQFIPKLFQLFSQEENGYSRSFDGNGLGLALVKKYCELNNARIFVNSKKGDGSTFTVILNLEEH